jgi:hypothetical protein
MTIGRRALMGAGLASAGLAAARLAAGGMFLSALPAGRAAGAPGIASASGNTR